MEINIAYIIQALTVLGVGSMVKWVYGINSDLQNHKLDVANNFHSKEELRQVLNDVMSPVKEELSRIRQTMERRQINRDHEQ